MNLGRQNMKTGPDALGTAENESGSAKTGKRDSTPWLEPKISPGAQNMKTRRNALGYNEYKHENGTRRTRRLRKRARAREI
jgi:hypothetical protein